MADLLIPIPSQPLEWTNLMSGIGMTHILTFDIEHWYESWRLRNLSGWEGFPDCDTPGIRRLLDLLERTGQTATFFFTGRFAREFPDLARECAARGHEVGTHSDEHTLLTRFPHPAAFREDLARSLDSVEAASGLRPRGFRAPKWSVGPENAAAVWGVLAELGLEYDSSVFPGHFPEPLRRVPHRIPTDHGVLYEIPATALRLGPLTVPVGGAYFRALPLAATRAMLGQRARQGLPGLLYAHPYDLNPDCHCPEGTPRKLRLLRRIGVRGAMVKLERLLRDYRFTRIDAWLERHGADLPEGGADGAG